MNTPRFNRQQCLLPSTLLPDHIIEVYKEILTDAHLRTLYNGSPSQCLQETLLGTGTPGININLLEQTMWAPNGVSSKPQFFPKNANHSMTRPDNELSLTFRHIDGFHNYWMLFFAVNYSQNHLQQAANNEQFIDLGNITIDYLLTKNYVAKTNYYGCVYESIEGFDSKFNAGISAETFTVRLKFTGYQTELWKDGKKIIGAENILMLDQSLAGPKIETQEWPYENVTK